MKFETLYNVATCHFRGSVSTQQTDVTMRDAPLHIWKFFCTYETVNLLTYGDVIEDMK